MKIGLLPIVFAWGALAQTPTSWTSEFAMQFQSIGSVVPSANGQWVAWTQIRNVIDTERSEQVSQIYLARADGSYRLQLTHDDKGSDPRIPRSRPMAASSTSLRIDPARTISTASQSPAVRQRS
jgi:hypothetical protein